MRLTGAVFRRCENGCVRLYSDSHVARPEPGCGRVAVQFPAARNQLYFMVAYHLESKLAGHPEQTWEQEEEKKKDPQKHNHVVFSSGVFFDDRIAVASPSRRD